jgi:IS1 family transposase
VLCKKKKAVSDEELEQEYGRKWIWTSIDSETRLMICFLIGNRTLEESKEFFRDLSGRFEGEKPLFTSDELPHYADAIMEQFHHVVFPEVSGNRGRPRKPYWEIDEDVDYATVHKTRENGRVVKVETKIVYGDAERIAEKMCATPSEKINTSFIERSNDNWRVWDSHLVRKGLTFAKSPIWLNAKFALVVAYYNFVRPHETLSRDKVTRSFHPKTPAIAAGLANSVWTLGYLLCYRIYSQ